MASALASTPLEMDRITFHVRGIDAIGADQGAGQPLLLIHGWGGGISNWRRMWPYLATRYRCVAPELPGWGDSEKPNVPYTFEWYADWLAELLKVRDAGPALVAGHSMGATIALVFALRHPSLVRKLVLLNPIVRGSDGVKRESRILSMPGLRRVAYWLTRLVGKGTFASMIRSLKALKSVDLTGALKSAAVPTLVIGSDSDREIPKEQSELAAGIPGARLEMLKGCGHVSPLERPEEVSSLLVDFLGPGMKTDRPPQW